MTLWDRHFYGPVALVRPFLLRRLFLLMLAFDAWTVSIDAAGKYGAGHFNVAHFAWLDAIVPMPSPELYAGMLVLIGLLAFVCALTNPNRLVLGLLTVLYTYSWAQSMLDSYQHHYLLSIVLICFVCFPPTQASELGENDAPTAKPAWGYVLLTASIAIVYGYTAYSKTESQWREGYALEQLTTPTHALFGLRDWFMAHGRSAIEFWQLVALGAIVSQIIICTSYFLSAWSERTTNRWLRAYLLLGYAMAMMFHVGAEYMELRIGWFSYYMMIAATVVLCPWPKSWLVALERVIRRIGNGWNNAFSNGSFVEQGLVLLIACVGLVAAGYLVDLPGSVAAGVAGSTMLAGAFTVLRSRHATLDTRTMSVAGLMAAVALWLAVNVSGMRYDLYRLMGGSANRLGDYDRALNAYKKAKLYAPPGEWSESREQRLRALQGRIGAP